MTKFTAAVLIIVLRLIYHPSTVQPGMSVAPFTSPSTFTLSAPAAKLISIKGTISNEKVILQWIVNENETADQFEVEKSIDGIDFMTAALVFGTDKPATANYEFYEKAGHKKVLYRVKLINKNQNTEYSKVVEINPAI